MTAHFHEQLPRMSSGIKNRAEVIIGGGIVGCSIAYHLTKRGVSDVVLLERRSLTSGTTLHAAGLVSQLRAPLNLTRLAQYTTDLYRCLSEETHQPTGFMQRGSLAVAGNMDRLHELGRGARCRRRSELRVLGAAEIEHLWPLIDARDLVLQTTGLRMFIFLGQIGLTLALGNDAGAAAAALQRVCRLSVDRHVPIGLSLPDAETAAAWHRCGGALFAIDSDHNLLRSDAEARARGFRTSIGESTT